ncbi:MAG: hypothetical protein C4547_00110 [Phycisphaerales bacterium]|nr:MAG: hypothetical protein C4547_00110 [Phycisphaerales bacterium]
MIMNLPAAGAEAPATTLSPIRRAPLGAANLRWALTGLLPALFLLAAVATCTFDDDRGRRMDLGVEARTPDSARSASYRDTIGAEAFFEGVRAMRVTGYGLVVGLGRNGASDCPKEIFDRVVRDIEKQMRTGPALVGASRAVTPEMLVRDQDTAVVLVYGDIPAGACTGDTFDVAVVALPGTDTKSLRGGRLFPCELEYSVAESPTAVRQSGRSLAAAAGPVFLNPFVGEQAATESTDLEGYVLGGGRVTEDRRLQLALAEPSHSAARRIERTINAQFPGYRKVADAVSPAFVRLDVPEQFRGDTEHFLGLVRAYFTPVAPGFIPQRCKELAGEIVRPDAPHGAIALCFEGIGQPAMPTLTELYTHPRDYVSFHAAAAGLRLEDHVAVDVMTKHAFNPQSPFRFQAIRALGRTSLATGATPLRRLMADVDPRVRVAAYEELSRRRDVSIRAERVGGDQFVLETVSSPRPPIIHARRSGQRRIALIGDGIRCQPPLFYASPAGALTVSAMEPSDDGLMLVRRTPSGGTSPPIPCGLDVAELLRLAGNDPSELQGTVTGLAMDYTAIVHLLHTLCHQRSINADFILEEANVAELFAPTQRKRRPESEL